jgi:hypothetical protein
LNAVIAPLILLVIIVLAMGLGVAVGYYALSGILYAMRREPQQVGEPKLATTEGLSGD